MAHKKEGTLTPISRKARVNCPDLCVDPPVLTGPELDGTAGAREGRSGAGGSLRDSSSRHIASAIPIPVPVPARHT